MENAFKEVASVWILTHALELRFGAVLAILSWTVYTRNAHLPLVRAAMCTMLAASVAAGFVLRQRETAYPAEALWSAAADGNSALVTRLVRAGADPDAQIDEIDAHRLQIVSPDDDGWPEDRGTWVADDYLLTPLQVAINNCHPEAVRALIDAGADVNRECVDSHGERHCGPLYIAGGRPQIIHALLVAGAWNLADDQNPFPETRLVAVPRVPPARGMKPAASLFGPDFADYHAPGRTALVVEQAPTVDFTDCSVDAGLVGVRETGASVNVALPGANWTLDPDRVHAIFAGEYHHAGPIWKHTTKHDGWYLTASGDLFDYEYGFSADDIVGGVLAYRCAPLLATKVGHVDERTLERERSLVAEAAGTADTAAAACLTASGETYTISTFVRDPGKPGAARRVILCRGNANGATPTNGAAAKLVTWLRGIHPD